MVNVKETYILRTFEPQVLKSIDRNVSARFSQPSIGRLSRKSEVDPVVTSTVV